eukprot:TRINITY_DN1871_c0_g1_i2.p1 TRINITY_DN1871_c0_g1~~TRINITY_DN1871_c0_g1_i2.p1  ORF type:complete len:887 (-),score=286.52 TRINITY_DN1871_c0_g1_i2:1931-4591(-)
MPPKRAVPTAKVVAAGTKPAEKKGSKPSGKGASAAVAAAAAAAEAVRKKQEEENRRKAEEEELARRQKEADEKAAEEERRAEENRRKRELERKEEEARVRRGQALSSKQKEKLERDRQRLLSRGVNADKLKARLEHGDEEAKDGPDLTGLSAKEQKEALRKAEEEREAQLRKARMEAKARERQRQQEEEEAAAAKAAAAADEEVLPDSWEEATGGASMCSKEGAAAATAAVETSAAAQMVGKLRSPILCVLGHVDTGKTKILDSIRKTNVQGGEAGGITQQIGATFLPAETIDEKRKCLLDYARGKILDGTMPPTCERWFDDVLEADASKHLPGVLVIDTPGHEAFSNFRSRGSSLCDIAILVVDIMHGLEAQTIESIDMLRKGKIPFIVALNKIDRCFEWKAHTGMSSYETLALQPDHVQSEFKDRLARTETLFAEIGLNAKLYWENPDFRKYVSLVPTSAMTGEGIPDLLHLVTSLTRTFLEQRITTKLDMLQCTVLEVKQVDGMGTIIDVVLVNGILREGSEIVVTGLHGPVQTKIRAICTPRKMNDLRVKNQYVHHKEVVASIGARIQASGLDDAVAGGSLLVVPPGASPAEVEAVRTEAQKEIKALMSRITLDENGDGVYAVASTLGSLEVLLSFLEEKNIPVAAASLGTIHKKDVVRASVALARGQPKYAVILAFDVQVSREARDYAAAEHVRIFTADIIYHLFDAFIAYLDEIQVEEKRKAAEAAVFPCILQTLRCFNAKNPLVLGIRVLRGELRVGTPLCIVRRTDKTEAHLDKEAPVPLLTAASKADIKVVGTLVSMERDHKPVEKAAVGDDVAAKIETREPTFAFNRACDTSDLLLSHITVESLDSLKRFFRDELTQDSLKTAIALKTALRVGQFD